MSVAKKLILVRDAMREDTPVIDGLASVTEAMDVLSKKMRRALIIEKRDAHDEYGLIDIRHIASDVVGPNRNPDRVSVYEIMDKPAVTVSVDMKARYAIRLLSRLGVDHAIVLDGGDLAGLVSLRDLVFAALETPIDHSTTDTSD